MTERRGNRYRVAAVRFDGFHNIPSRAHIAEDHMFPIQVRGLLEANKERGAVGVRARVGHRQDSWTGVAEDRAVKEGAANECAVPQAKVLVRKFATVDGLPATGGSLEALWKMTRGEGDVFTPPRRDQTRSKARQDNVRTLTHEAGDDTMENRLFEMQWPARLTQAPLA
jgi:hypothetical protein